MSIIIQGKIDKLRDYYRDEDSRSLLDSMEKRLNESVIKQEIPEMPAIKEVVASGQKVIEDLNFILLNDEKLTERERDRLLERRKAHEFYIDRLSGKTETARLASMEKFLDERIKIIGDITP